MVQKEGARPSVQRRRGLWPAHQPHPPPSLAGALDITSCPQSRKNVLCDKAREAFGSARTAYAYYSFTNPHLGETSPCVGHASRKPRPGSPAPHRCPAPRRYPRGGATAPGPGYRLRGH